MYSTPLYRIYFFSLFLLLYACTGGSSDPASEPASGSQDDTDIEDGNNENPDNTSETIYEISTGCPEIEEQVFETLTMALTPGIVLADTQGDGGNVEICRQVIPGKPKNAVVYLRDPKAAVRNSSTVDTCWTVDTGEKAFQRELNQFLGFGSLRSVEYGVKDRCDCNQEIYQITLDTIPLEIQSGIAGTRPRKKSGDQGNGMLAGLGVNHRLTIGPLFKESQISTPYCDEVLVSEDKEAIKKKQLQNAEKLRKAADASAQPSDCIPIFLPPPSERSPTQVRVFVIDTGVDPSFAYLGFEDDNYGNYFFPTGWGEERISWKPKMDLNALGCKGLFGVDFLSGEAPTDNHGHGSFLSDIILSGNTSWGNNIQVTALKIGEYVKTSKGDSVLQMNLWEAVCAIHYAIDNDADIINLSWGYRANFSDAVLQDAIARATEQGIIFVTSAGNDTLNTSICKQWPSSLNDTFPGKLLSVAALDADSNGMPINQLAAYSNYGNTVDLAAPGTDIWGAIIKTGNDRQRGRGTSLAAAFVTRELAKLMVQSVDNEPPDRIATQSVVPRFLSGLDMLQHNATNIKYYLRENSTADRLFQAPGETRE